MKQKVFLSLFLFLKISLATDETPSPEPSSGEGPLNFTYDRIDGRIVWINNSTSDIVEKIEYRRLFKDANGTRQPSTAAWSPLPYDQHQPGWQKPDGVCAEYEISMTTREGRTYSHTLDAPIPALKQPSKLRPMRIYFDPNRNRVMIELAWGNDFDYWTAAGAVLVQSFPWAKLITCQSLFRAVVPPPTVENGGTVLSFDPEYARNNCSFLIGVNGTIDMMQVPPANRAQQLVQVGNGQLIQVAAADQQRTNIDPNCTRIDFSTSMSNDSLQLNLTCETVSGSPAFCVPPPRQCKLDCSPIAIHAYNMQDDGDYLKIDWQFPDALQREIKRYQVRYVEANVTTWNTAYSDQAPTDLTADANYVEIKKFSGEAGNAQNFTVQICANLNENCSTQIMWDEERKYAVAYVPTRQEASANLLFAGSSRRRGKNSAVRNGDGKNGLMVFFLSLVICFLLL